MFAGRILVGGLGFLVSLFPTANQSLQPHEIFFSLWGKRMAQTLLLTYTRHVFPWVGLALGCGEFRRFHDNICKFRRFHDSIIFGISQTTLIDPPLHDVDVPGRADKLPDLCPSSSCCRAGAV